MDKTWEFLTNRWTVTVGAFLVPLLVCVVLIPVRADFNNTNAALLLVLVVVGFAATGRREAGIVAALSAGIWFDFFLTTPYQSFEIHSGDDVETAALLLLVGVGVAELAAWGRRQQAAASRDEGYLAGVSAASEVVARGTLPPSQLIERVCRQLENMLDLRSCRFDYGTSLDHPRLHRTGEVVWHHDRWTVTQSPPPTDKAVELLAESGGSFRGRFLLDAPAGLRLTRTQVLIAFSLADEVAAALAEFESRPHSPGRLA